MWCRSDVFGSQLCTGRGYDAQLRTLRLTPGGGRLTQGSVLLADSRRYPDIIQALAGPGGTSINLVELTGPDVGTVNPEPRDLRVVQVPLARGRPRLLYHAAVDGHPQVFLGSDASGRYLLLAWARNGWIDHGRAAPAATGPGHVRRGLVVAPGQAPDTSRTTGSGGSADHQSPAGMPRPSSRCQSGASAASGLR